MNYLKAVFLAVLCTFYAVSYAAAPIPFDFEKPVKCAKTVELLEYFESQYGETVKWLAKDGSSDSYFAVLMNDNKLTWTIMQFDTEVACVLGTGKQVKLTDL
jgi:hypothetical protein